MNLAKYEVLNLKNNFCTFFPRQICVPYRSSKLTRLLQVGEASYAWAISHYPDIMNYPTLSVSSINLQHCFVAVFQDSLGGNAVTCMIVNLAPEEQHYFDTYTTLNFARKTKKIVNTIKINESFGEILSYLIHLKILVMFCLYLAQY